MFAIVATHLAAAAGALTWMALEWSTRGKPSVLGMISGAVAGLGTITPASGYVLPWHGVVIGVIAGAICFWACTWLKQRLRYDDSLDVFGVHGIGGATGTLLAGVFAVAAVSVSPDTPAGLPGLLDGNPRQVLIQLHGILVTLVWSGVLTFVLAEGDRVHGAAAGRPAARDRGARRDAARRGAAIDPACRSVPASIQVGRRRQSPVVRWPGDCASHGQPKHTILLKFYADDGRSLGGSPAALTPRSPRRKERP